MTESSQTINTSQTTDRESPGAVRLRNAAPDLLLYSELFPPFVGGSAVLFENVYARVGVDEVVVLTDRGRATSPQERTGRLAIRRERLLSHRWGVAHPSSLLHHCRSAWILRSIDLASPAIVHCGRALPEGLNALLATAGTRRQYLCWTHGEELAYARTSRELTFLMKRVHRKAAAIVANSAHTARMLTAFGAPADRIHVVYPGVDSSRFRPSIDASGVRRRIARSGDLLLLSIGRLQRRKGHDLVIQALAACRQALPQLRYVIIGDGDERPRLEQMVRELGLGGTVTFEGEVPADSLPAYYAACDIFVMPNRVDGVDVEGFGIVFLEAAATGRPTIGGRSGGVPEAIDENRTGLLVSGTDAPELVAALTHLAGSAELRTSMGAAGRARVVERFNWERAAADVTALHRSLLKDDR